MTMSWTHTARLVQALNDAQRADIFFPEGFRKALYSIDLDSPHDAPSVITNGESVFIDMSLAITYRED
ncbi:hypothetical protein EW145_g6056 [Phellinidium pouzarii]|uniref:Uncharacterized protein n=1 Tax=Phellinidium pouzarii TaxID=167371 RepID=A0A4V3XBY3_9AGAM|nr:hypothetical protein EW145_g6056 [Phellinidium pouzarii]